MITGVGSKMVHWLGKAHTNLNTKQGFFWMWISLASSISDHTIVIPYTVYSTSVTSPDMHVTNIPGTGLEIKY